MALLAPLHLRMLAHLLRCLAFSSCAGPTMHRLAELQACVADISPGFAGAGAFFNSTYRAAPLPNIGKHGVSGLMLAAGDQDGNSVQGYIC